MYIYICIYIYIYICIYKEYIITYLLTISSPAQQLTLLYIHVFVHNTYMHINNIHSNTYKRTYQPHSPHHIILQTQIRLKQQLRRNNEQADGLDIRPYSSKTQTSNVSSPSTHTDKRDVASLSTGMLSVHPLSKSRAQSAPFARLDDPVLSSTPRYEHGLVYSHASLCVLNMSAKTVLFAKL